METAQTIPEWKAAADEIWAILREHAQFLKETDQQLKETDRIVRENAKQLGGIHNRFGEIVEYMVAPNLKAKFKEIGLSFQETSKDKEIVDKDGKFLFEVDVLLENGEKALLVETKTKPTTEDVNGHVERLKKMRTWADLKGDRRKFLGAIAGVVMTKNVKDYALQNGFYVIEPTGETFSITVPEGDYTPKTW
ncbi:hypothetical protein AGMMS50230_23090 [Spirochaetia bacterium]|nr:hypothetical protein AGMMS50230_23090 [Spirochaetia bacterium]